MDTRERLISNARYQIQQAKPRPRWGAHWAEDERPIQRLSERIADAILKDPGLEVRSVDRKPAPAHSCPGGKMHD